MPQPLVLNEFCLEYPQRNMEVVPMILLRVETEILSEDLIKLVGSHVSVETHSADFEK